MSNIFVTGHIQILSDPGKVFDYISNLENDQFWRKEINRTTMNAKPQVGAVATEDSYLSKKVPSHVLVLACTEYAKDKKIVYQTRADSKFYLKSTRQVEPFAGNACQFKYTIEFDKNIVRYGLGFGLPSFLIEWVANSDMKKYLVKLKAILEANN